MIQKLKVLFAVFLSILLLGSCSAPVKDINLSEGRLNIVATTTMLADLSEIIGGEHVSVSCLMGPGVDPHLYQASAGDVTLLQEADIVVYNGLHLEGKMGDVFASLTDTSDNKVVCIKDGIDSSKFLTWEGEEGIYDPHIWFDVSLWTDAAKYLYQRLAETDPSNALNYESNLERYLSRLEDLDEYIRNRIAEIPENQRILITAHDAFNYFGKAYGVEVRGLQGISTEAEAGTADVSKLAEFTAENKIKAIFIESSVPTKTIEALQAAVKAKGFDVTIGGELYSDSLGGEGSGAETYILTVKANVNTIVNALK